MIIDIKKNLVIILIIIFAASLRLTMLDVYPFGFTPDEASFGYDAYSILITGKDQWGESFPLVLKSFGDYKPPLYSYLSIPSIAIFGLDKFSIRLTNALFGVAAVFITYLLAGEFGKLSKLSSKRTKKLQLVSALLLAVSPWHVMMSRGAFEANLTTFFMPLGIYLFLKALREKRSMLPSAVIFGLNLFSYHSARFVVPLIVFILVVIFWKKIRKLEFRQLRSGLIVFAGFLMLSFYTLSIGGAQRAKDISILSGAAQAAAGDRLIALERGVPHLIAKSMHNKYVIIAERFIDNYSQYFSYNFLFTNGPAEGTYGMMPGEGVTYWFILPFLLFALYYLFRQPKDKPLWIIISWLLLAPIPASLTTGAGHAANRAVIMLPALQLFAAYGAVELFGKIRKYLPSRSYLWFRSVYVLIIIISVFGFLHKYFVLSPFKTANAMLYGRYEAALASSDYFDVDQEVLVSTSLSEPHIYFAFAQMIDPEVYQKYSSSWDMDSHKVNWVDQLPEYRLGRYTFKRIDWNKDSVIYSNFIGLPGEFPLNVTPNIKLYYPNLEEAIYIINEDINVYAYKNN